MRASGVANTRPPSDFFAGVGDDGVAGTAAFGAGGGGGGVALGCSACLGGEGACGAATGAAEVGAPVSSEGL